MHLFFFIGKNFPNEEKNASRGCVLARSGSLSQATALGARIPLARNSLLYGGHKMKKRNDIRKITLAAMFLALAFVLPFYRTNTADWRYVVPDAYSGAVVWIFLWCPLGACCRLCCATFTVFCTGNAANVSKGFLHGV